RASFPTTDRPYCLAHPDQFPDDRSKIIFMLTNLSGNPAKWAQPLNQWPNSSPVSKSTSSTLSARVRPIKPSLPSSNPAMWSPTPSSSMRTFKLQLCHLLKPSPPSPKSRLWPCNLETNLKPMQWTSGQLTSAEHVKMMQDGQSFQCRQVGHISRDCPKKKNPRKYSRPIRLADLQMLMDHIVTGNQASSSKNGTAQE
ncbi:hypothetical protein VP01_10051g1, partial [Puccinia sorghi]